jgi:hypothetical protein
VKGGPGVKGGPSAGESGPGVRVGPGARGFFAGDRVVLGQRVQDQEVASSSRKVKYTNK